MSALPLVLYIFLFGIGLLTIILSLFQYRKYHQRFYSFFLYYLIANFIFGFLNYFGRFIAKTILSELDISSYTRNGIDLFLHGLALPFCFIGLYFFINLSFLEKIMTDHKKQFIALMRSGARVRISRSRKKDFFALCRTKYSLKSY